MDEFIVKQLKNLRKVRPSASLLSNQRSFLLSKVSKTEEPIKQVVFNFSKFLKPAFALAFILVILISSFGTISVISASQNSLPGDPLYVLKTAFEQTQMTFASSRETKAKLSIKFASQRIDEFSQIANKPEKEKDVEKTVQKITEQLLAVQESMNKLKERNSQKAAEVAKIIDKQAAIYAETLIKTSEQLAYIMPEEKERIKSEIDQALVEINNTQESAKQMIKVEGNSEESDILVPTGEEQTESESIPFEKINE